ncbi:NfeD family protein [Cellulomonas gelida]|uniref:NfeD family protein n=1 Tax=Cellulomonas gelida TaxID=1712 RepID=UPI00360F78CF
MHWLWWVGGALALGILEMLSLELVFIMAAGGAVAGGVASAAGAPLWAQIVIAAVTSVLLLVTLRPWLLRHLKKRTPLVETNASALVGRPAVVLATVTADAGRVRLAGEVWSARTTAGSALPPGTEVTVDRIEGATAVVVPAPAG